MIMEIATVNDAREILELQKRAYQSEAAIYDDYTIPPLAQTLEQMEVDLERNLALKVVAEGRIIGSVRAYSQDRTCFIGRLIVDPGCQNRGIGTWLMKEIEGRFAGVCRYELFTGERSTRNLHLYQKLGYRVFRTQQVTGKVTIVYLEKVREGSGTEGQPRELPG